jgi:phosphoglycolate phosphatase-like HAD superfamily hydrolase
MTRDEAYDLLDRLARDGRTLCLASSKPEVFVRRILEHFSLSGYFQQIVGSEAVALSAIPRCGISFITGGDAKAILDDYFAVMFESNPESIGGAIPDDAIYYMP